jgi:hypothetical protein
MPAAKLKSPMADLALDTKARQNRLCNCRLRASPYANGCLLARRLVESGVRYVHLYWPAAAPRAERPDGSTNEFGFKENPLRGRRLPPDDVYGNVARDSRA